MKTKEIDFDEFNSLDIYYSPMQIDIGSKKRRKELANYLIDAFLFFFSAFEVHQQYNQLLQQQLYQQLLADKISDAVTKVTGIDSYMSSHIKEMSREVVNTTFKNATKDEAQVKPVLDSPSKSPREEHSHSTKNQNINPNGASADNVRSNPASLTLIDHHSKEPLDSPTKNTSSGSTHQNQNQSQDGSYWLSYKRAEDIAKSEANTFLNYTDYVDAKDSGYTKKRWLTMLDDKVRQTHTEVEGDTVGIDELFHVGNSQMRFPHDLASSPDPKEVIGCRCAVEYLK